MELGSRQIGQERLLKHELQKALDRRKQAEQAGMEKQAAAAMEAAAHVASLEQHIQDLKVSSSMCHQLLKQLPVQNLPCIKLRILRVMFGIGLLLVKSRGSCYDAERHGPFFLFQFRKHCAEVETAHLRPQGCQPSLRRGKSMCDELEVYICTKRCSRSQYSCLAAACTGSQGQLSL